jgi:hypothetical protein
MLISDKIKEKNSKKIQGWKLEINLERTAMRLLSAERTNCFLQQFSIDQF